MFQYQIYPQQMSAEANAAVEPANKYFKLIKMI